MIIIFLMGTVHFSQVKKSDPFSIAFVSSTYRDPVHFGTGSRILVILILILINMKRVVGPPS